MIRGVEHIALCARDPASLLAWYKSIFDLTLVKETDSGPFFLRFPDGLLIEFLQADSAEPSAPGVRAGGFRHVAFTVSGIEKLVVSLKTQEVEVVDEFKVVANGTKLFLFRDIEGNLIQLVERPSPLGS